MSFLGMEVLLVQSTNQLYSLTHSLTRSINQSVNQSISQSFHSQKNQPNNQSKNQQPINQSMIIMHFIYWTDYRSELASLRVCLHDHVSMFPFSRTLKGPRVERDTEHTHKASAIVNIDSQRKGIETWGGQVNDFSPPAPPPPLPPPPVDSPSGEIDWENRRVQR